MSNEAKERGNKKLNSELIRERSERMKEKNKKIIEKGLQHFKDKKKKANS